MGIAMIVVIAGALVFAMMLSRIVSTKIAIAIALLLAIASAGWKSMMQSGVLVDSSLFIWLARGVLQWATAGFAAGVAMHTICPTFRGRQIGFVTLAGALAGGAGSFAVMSFGNLSQIIWSVIFGAGLALAGRSAVEGFGWLRVLLIMVAWVLAGMSSWFAGFGGVFAPHFDYYNFGTSYFAIIFFVLTALVVIGGLPTLLLLRGAQRPR